MSYQHATACNLPKGQIEQIATRISAWASYQAGRDNIQDVVKKLGGEVAYLGWEDWLVHDRDTIVVNGPGVFTIRLLGVDGPLRNHFTIAHELGHYVLHSRLGKVAPLIAGRKGSTRVEWEANWFAASLLMPEEAFRKAAQTGCSILELAARFNVSVEAAEVRRKVLEV
jgi:hypothetical protein